MAALVSDGLRITAIGVVQANERAPHDLECALLQTYLLSFGSMFRRQMLCMLIGFSRPDGKTNASELVFGMSAATDSGLLPHHPSVPPSSPIGHVRVLSPGQMFPRCGPSGERIFLPAHSGKTCQFLHKNFQGSRRRAGDRGYGARLSRCINHRECARTAQNPQTRQCHQNRCLPDPDSR